MNDDPKTPYEDGPDDDRWGDPPWPDDDDSDWGEPTWMDGRNPRIQSVNITTLDAWEFLCG